MIIDENQFLRLISVQRSINVEIMKNFLHIFFALLITLAAVIPSGLVVCEKDGNISIEFESGEICSCDTHSRDMAEKFCCEDTQCHENESVTMQCHDENELSSGDCNDTKIENFDALKYFSQNIKIPVKIFIGSDFFKNADLIPALTFETNSISSFSDFLESPQIQNQTLTIKETTVFII